MSQDRAYETEGVAGCAMGRSPTLILLRSWPSVAGTDALMLAKGVCPASSHGPPLLAKPFFSRSVHAALRSQSLLRDLGLR